MFDLLHALHTKLLLPIILAGVVILGIVRLVLKGLGIGLPASAITWQSYLQGQGTLLFAFLLLGAGLGWVSVNYGSGHGHAIEDGKLIEYRQVNVGDHPIYEDIDMKGYNHLSMFAKVLAPQAAKLSIRVIPDASMSSEQSILFESTDSSWSRLEERVLAPQIMLIIGSTPSSTTKATQADILVFLSKD